MLTLVRQSMSARMADMLSWVIHFLTAETIACNAPYQGHDASLLGTSVLRW